MISVETCPSSHTYAFRNGKLCCRTNREGNNEEKYGDLCDGSKIGLSSSCCYNDDHIKCSYEKCDNHEDVAEDESG